MHFKIVLLCYLDVYKTISSLIAKEISLDQSINRTAILVFAQFQGNYALHLVESNQCA